MFNKVIIGNENYSVSDKGVVTNIKTARILKQDTSRRYPSVRLGKYGGVHSVHRLVALAFIPNPNNKEQVNHKDGCKTNNSIDNLEWMTREENKYHAQQNGLIKTRLYPIFRRNKITQDEASELCEAYATGFFTQREIAKHIKLSLGRVSQLINNKWSLAA